MDWNTFEQAVKDRKFLPVYLFAGPEELKKKEALEALRSAVLPAGLEQLNEAVLENCAAQDIVDAAETLPVMCERRIVVVRDWPPLLPGKAKNEEADVQRILEYLRNPAETTVLIFYLSKDPDARKKLFDYLKKSEGAVVFNRLEGTVLAKWCAEQLAPRGKKLLPQAFTLLTEMVGNDLTRLSAELSKLAAFTQDAKEITPADVKKVVVPTPEYRAYEILDKLLTGKLAEASEIVNSVLQNDTNCVGLIVQLGNSLRILAHVKLAAEAGRNVDSVLAELGIRGGRTYFIKKQIRLLPAAAFTERYLACTAAQFDVTSGRLKDRAALDMLLLKITV